MQIHLPIFSTDFISGYSNDVWQNVDFLCNMKIACQIKEQIVENKQKKMNRNIEEINTYLLVYTHMTLCF